MSLSSALSVALEIAAQAEVSDRGTAQAAAGAMKRLQDPTYYDAVFPFIAFFLVIVIPACVALWVIFKTVTDKTMEQDEA